MKAQRPRLEVMQTATITLGSLLFLAGLAAAPAADAPWRVPDAAARFSLTLTKPPTHASAGYFAHLPDGGVLPRPFPVTTVVVESDAGEPRVVESFQLWHNKASGLSFVFADPGAVKSVHVYVSNAAPRLWKPASGLTPSAILCADPTVASIAAAQQLGKLGQVGATVHARNKAGISQAPFSLGGDDSGRPRPVSFYLLSHLVTSDPGKTWVAPFTLDGESELLIDGKRITPEQRIDKWGGTGAYVDFDKGLHRVEVFQTAPGTGPFAAGKQGGGLMYLTWRTPNASMEELGGVRSDKVPMPGTSRLETRLINDSEIVRSGHCQLEGGTTKGGAPVACVALNPTHTFWFEGESPLLLYEVRALTAGHPADTKYTWEFPGKGKVEGASARWLFPGFQETGVTLVATSGKGSTSCAQPFFGFGTAATSLANPQHREAFRAACTGMLAAYPTSPDPVASWGSAYWNNLIRTLELGKGYPLLENLFTARLKTVNQKLNPEQLAVLQDVLLDMAPRQDPQAALKLVDSLAGPATNASPRRDQLMIRKAELLMYYLGDLESAGRGLTKFASGGKGEIAEWASVRLGDIAFLSGDLNLATKYYADVQNKARKRRNTAGALSHLVTEDLLKTDQPGGAGDGNADPGGLPDTGAPDWKTGALRDVSLSENVATLLADGFLLEAQQALRIWEREFPLSKISGDYILRESKLYMQLGDWKRARPMLEAYCREMDASSFLPDAARQLIECAQRLGLPPSEIREVIEKVSERLEFHPVAAELKTYLGSRE